MPADPEHAATEALKMMENAIFTDPQTIAAFRLPIKASQFGRIARLFRHCDVAQRGGWLVILQPNDSPTP